MKLIYLSRYSDSTSSKFSGVDKKIASQVSSLRNLGVDASVLFITENAGAQSELPYVRFVIRPESSKSRFRILTILSRERFFIRSTWEVIHRMKADEILYMRFSYPFFRWWYCMQKNRSCKIVVEHQALESQSYLMAGNYLYPLFDHIFGGSIRRHCDGIIGVTREITDYEIRRSGDYRKPHITIGNGINVDSIPKKTSSDLNEGSLHLLCVANVSRWHGLDRVLRGMAEYKGPVKIHLHIVGDGRELPAIKEMVKAASLEDNVTFYGPLHGRELDELFNRSDIAIGSLAIHRIRMREASILKAREYCARGIPFLYGTDDADFPPGFPYILRIPPDESPVDIAGVTRFAKTVYADRDFSVKMREFAEESLDWSVKAQKLKNFLESLP